MVSSRDNIQVKKKRRDNKQWWHVFQCPTCGGKTYMSSESCQCWCNKTIRCKGNREVYVGKVYE